MIKLSQFVTALKKHDDEKEKCINNLCKLYKVCMGVSCNLSVTYGVLLILIIFFMNNILVASLHGEM